MAQARQSLLELEMLNTPSGGFISIASMLGKNDNPEHCNWICDTRLMLVVEMYLIAIERYLNWPTRLSTAMQVK